MEKQRKTVKQDKNSNSLSIKESQGPLVPFKGYREYSEPYPVNCFANTESPTRWKKLTACCSQAYRPLDGTRRLMMLISNYLTIKQSEECP